MGLYWFFISIILELTAQLFISYWDPNIGFLKFANLI